MPAAVIAAAIEWAATALATEMVLTAGEILMIANVISVASAVYTLREQQLRAQSAARDAYNANLRDRYVMSRGATEPRQVVLGRQRVSGPISFVQSYGVNREHLVMCVILAAHEIDAVEAIYLDNERVTLDGAGNVLSVSRRETFTLTTTGAAYTLQSTPATGTVTASVAYGTTVVNLGVSVAGLVATVTGGTTGQTGTVAIQYLPQVSPYTSSNTQGQHTTAPITLDSSGNGSITLPSVPIAGSVHAFYTTYSGSYSASDPPPALLDGVTSVAGAVVTVTGGQAGITGLISYNAFSATAPQSKMRIRSYLGMPGQAADAGMIAALPGIWTSAHSMAGLAYLVVECDYDPDAFPGGLPNVSALVRGAKVYDPRTGLTAWSQNPALLMRYVATSPLLGRLSAVAISDTSVAAAANICDSSASYLVNGQTFVRSLYTAGWVGKSGIVPKNALDDIATAMAGRWCFIDGVMRIRAGAYSTPLQALDETWLHAGQAVQIQAKPNRQDVFNVTSGKFSDESRDWQVLDYPRVAAAAYIAEDGAELPLDVQLGAVTFVGQAQQVVAAMMRDARQGLRVTLTCNMRAYPVEVFDVITVSLDRFGWIAKPFEVLDINWSLDGGIQLSLKATDPATWALGTSFSTTAAAPNTLLASPWYVPALAGLTCASGTAQLLKTQDGTIITRLLASWSAITDANVISSGGGIEVRYGLAVQSETLWRSFIASGSQTQLFMTGVLENQIYLVKARAFNSLVKGAWCSPVIHIVVGKSAPPATVTGFAGAISKGIISWTWAACPDVDYAYTEVRSSDANWGSNTVAALFKGASNGWTEPITAAGQLTRYVRHIDTTGNSSAATTGQLLTVAIGNVLGALATLNTVGTTELALGSATDTNSMLSAVSGGIYGFSSGGLIVDGLLYTPPVACTVSVRCTYEAQLFDGLSWDAQRGAACFAVPYANTSSGFGFSPSATNQEGYRQPLTTARAQYSIEQKFNVPAGSSYMFGLSHANNPSGSTTRYWNLRISIEAIKR